MKAHLIALVGIAAAVVAFAIESLLTEYGVPTLAHLGRRRNW